MDFIEMGNGSLDDMMSKLPEHNKEYALVRDDDAAEAGASTYWLTDVIDVNAVRSAYEKDGGTASWITIVCRKVYDGKEEDLFKCKISQ